MINREGGEASSQRDVRLKLIEFLVLIEGLLGIAISSNPTILAVEGDTRSLNDIFIISLIFFMVYGVMAYIRILANTNNVRRFVFGFLGYFWLTIGMIFGASMARMFDGGIIAVGAITIGFALVFYFLVGNLANELFPPG